MSSQQQQQRIEALEDNPPSGGSASSSQAGGAPKKLSVKLASNLFLNLPQNLSELSLSKIGKTRMIACFMIDGSDRYTNMTINAINSFLRATPEMHAGVLVPPTWGVSIFATRVVPRLIAPERVIFKNWSQHFAQWNPTQYKLDIIQFAEDYDVVLWLDSDTVVYDDLRPLLFAFYKSPAKFMFVRDHASYNPEFLANWPFKSRQGSAFIPQACFMAFKSEHMKRLFRIWEDTWRQWIEPEPFKNFSDPLPSFPGSRFCIEQYALGHAFVIAEIGEEDILEIARSNIVLNTRNPSQASTADESTLPSGQPSVLAGYHAGSTTGTPRQSALAGSTANTRLPSSHYLASSAFLSFLASSTTSSYSGSYSGSYFSSYLSSYGSSYLSSYNSFGSYLTSVVYFDGTTTTLPPEFGRAGSDVGYVPGGQQAAGQHQGAPQHQPDLPEFIFADHLGGCVVHFYSSFYDAAHRWWEANEATIVKVLKA